MPVSKPHYQEELEVLVKRLGLAHIVEFLGRAGTSRKYSLRLIFWSCLPLLMRPLAGWSLRPMPRECR